MKNLIKTTMVIALVAFMASCAGGPSAAGGGSKAKTTDYSTYPTLADALRTVGGLQVSGSAPNLNVTVRGGAINSMSLSNLPLFVIDNVPVGTSYADASSIVNPSQIASIRVLNGTRGVTKYGNDGNAGVIEIKTKTN